jgi:transposase
MMDRERLAHLAKTLAEEALSHGDQLDALRARIAELEAERDAAKAGEARAVEGLRRIREELETIAAGKEEEVRNDFSSGESHGWGSAYLHVCRIIGNAATQPALDWLAQREREAVVAELREWAERWWESHSDFSAGDFEQRIAALTNQQPTACPRSEVWGVENNNA